MGYTYDKPDASDALSASQSVLKENFTAIKALVDINHVTFGDPNQGKHAYVTMPEQTSLPTISASEFSLFTASDGINRQIYLRNNSSGAIDVTKDVNLTGGLKAATGWCQLANGIIMKWGAGSVTAGTSGAYGTATDLISGSGIPTITTLLTAMVTVTGNGKLSIGYGGSFSEAGHWVQVHAYSLGTTSHTATFNYLLIGI